MRNKKGFTLVAAIFILLVMTLLAVTTSTFISSDAVIAVKNYYSQDAFYVASSGMEYYLKQLDDDEKIRLHKSFHPDLKKYLLKCINWLETGIVKPTGEKNEIDKG